jgi:hypothetical protein
MPECMVPGCVAEARNSLSVRVRKPTTLAVFSPNCDAFLCKAHAEGGAEFTIDFVPTASGAVETTVMCGGSIVSVKKTPIQHSAV